MEQKREEPKMGDDDNAKCGGHEKSAGQICTSYSAPQDPTIWLTTNPQPKYMMWILEKGRAMRNFLI